MSETRGRFRERGGFGLGPNGDCECPKCGYTENRPCFLRRCPKCGERMRRKSR